MADSNKSTGKKLLVGGLAAGGILGGLFLRRRGIIRGIGKANRRAVTSSSERAKAELRFLRRKEYKRSPYKTVIKGKPGKPTSKAERQKLRDDYFKFVKEEHRKAARGNRLTKKGRTQRRVVSKLFPRSRSLGLLDPAKTPKESLRVKLRHKIINRLQKTAYPQNTMGDHEFSVTTSDVHVDSALHIPKRNKRLRRTPAKGYNAPMTTSKVSTPMALPNKGRMTPTDQTRGFSAPEGNVAYADEKKNKEFAVGALAKVGLGLLKKKKQIVPGTSVKSGISRLQPRRTSATLSPSGQAQKKAADAQKIAAKKAATAQTRTTDSQRRRTQAAKNPLLSTKAGKQARRLKRGIKRNPQRSAAIAAGAGLGAGYLLSNDEEFGALSVGRVKAAVRLGRRRLKKARTPSSKSSIDNTPGPFRADTERKLNVAEAGLGVAGGGAGIYAVNKQQKNKKAKSIAASDIVFNEEDFAALDKIVKNVRENSKNSDGEYADETKKELTLRLGQIKLQTK